MGPTEEPASAVCDAGPLIHLDQLGSLDLIEGFADLIIPEQVWREVERHRPGALARPSLGLVPVPVSITRDAELVTLFQSFSLAEGEQAALSFLSANRRHLLLTDDAAARLAAKILGIRSYGTLGLFLRAIRRRRRTREEVVEQLERLPEVSTLYVRASLLQEVIEEVKGSSLPR